jgi:hypothetical protein
MKQPCNHCPFRSDRPFRGLYEEKANDIVHALFNDGSFHCHKTHERDDEGDTVVTENSTLCIGAAIFLENTNPNGMLSNLSFRIGAMTGELRPEELSKAVPVYKSREEFIQGASI